MEQLFRFIGLGKGEVKSVPPRKLDQRNPYTGLYNGQPVIRGHHLGNLRMIYDQALDEGLFLPREGFLDPIPDEAVSHLNRWIVKYASSNHKDIKWGGVNSLGEKWVYGEDTCGFTEADAKQYDLRYFQAILRYVAMPATQTVYISKYPDSICRACHIGAHCDPNIPESNERNSIIDFWQYSQMFGLRFLYLGDETVETAMGDVRDYIYWKNLHERIKERAPALEVQRYIQSLQETIVVSQDQ